MSSIIKAMASGYSAQKILDFLAKRFPSLGQKIQKAQSFGYTVPQILNFLATSDELKGEDIRGLSESEVYGKAKELQNIRRERGAIAAASLVPAISGLANVATSSPKLPIGPTPMANAPVMPPQIPPVPQGGATSQISSQAPISATAAAQIPQAPVQTASLQDSLQVVRDMGLEGKIKNLKEAGNDADVISGVIENTLTPGQKKWLADKIKAGEAKPVPELVKDYLSSSATQEPVIEEASEVKEPAKGDIVFDPKSGVVGSLHDMKEKQALVEEDGKLHKVNLDDLEKTPEELIETVQNLLNIPEVDRSSVLSLLTYRPSTKQMFVQYHNGETYVYEDVATEKMHEIANALGVPVTTGKNIFGAWEEGKRDSRGAALIHGIIRDPKYSKDQEGKTWEKIGTFYDYWKGLRKQPKRKKK